MIMIIIIMIRIIIIIILVITIHNHNTNDLMISIVIHNHMDESSKDATRTNMYLVGTGARRILVDAGEGKPGVLDDLLRVMRDEGCAGLDQIVITHWHHDHLEGLPELLRHFGAVPVLRSTGRSMLIYWVG